MENTKERIAAAWDRAQVAFKAMLDAGVWGEPDAPETAAYTAAERELDRELAEARWAARNPQPVSTHDPDCDCHYINRDVSGVISFDPDLALGDHHVGVGS